MRTHGAMTVATVIVATSILLAVAAPVTNAQDPIVSPARPLVTRRTDQMMAGRFAHGAYVGSFEARRVSPTQATAQVRVGLPAGATGPEGEAERELVLDASASLSEDGRKTSVIVDGHGRKLTPGLKRALTDLSLRLERHLDPYGQELPPQEDLLVRSSLYWAEAPVGLELERREVRPPAR